LYKLTGYNIPTGKNPKAINRFFFAVALRPKAGNGLLILEVSRSHAVGLLWTSDRLVAETYT
jgi:hypothetical protein